MSARATIKCLAVVVLVAIGATLAIAGCGGGSATTTLQTSTTLLSPTATTTTTTEATVPLDELSTFQAKDPFIPQALTSTTATSSTLSTLSTTTTLVPTTSTTHATTTTTHSGTTSTTVPTSVTSATHSLKVLSIDVVNGTPVVTFEVDGTTYADKEVGDVFNTSWGQIKVISINPQAQTVTFLHGSEVRTLGVGQEITK